MCEPVSIGLGALALGGAAFSAYGQNQAGKYEEELANRNATMLDQQAVLSEQRGRIDAEAQKMRSAQEIGDARAQLATTGLDMSSGTPLDVITDARMLSELDSQTIANNAAREAWGYRVGAVEARAQGALARQRAKYGAISTLLGGAAQAGQIGASGLKMPTGGTSAGALV